MALKNFRGGYQKKEYYMTENRLGYLHINITKFVVKKKRVNQQPPFLDMNKRNYRVG